MTEVNVWAKPSLEIVLDAPCYFPGDVITGTVKRRAGNAGVVSPLASIHLKFFGRVVVRFPARHSDNRRNGTEHEAFTTEMSLIDQRYTLYDGPLHIPPGRDQEPASWPFSIPLPLHPSPRCPTMEQPVVPYLSLHPDDVPTHNLPFSFNSHETLPNLSTPVHIEYGLLAEIFEEHNGHRVKLPITSKATIKVRPPPAPPIMDSALCHREVRRMVESHRLLRPNGNHHLTLLQKTKQVFQLSKTPYYLFNVQVDYPTTIQLDSLTPVPFLLRIGPAREGDVNAPASVLANSLTHNTLPFHLTGVNFKIKAFTAVSLPQHRHERPEHVQTIGELSVRFDPDSDPKDDPYQNSNHQAAPIIPDCSSRDDSENVYNPPPMMDVGELLDLRFGPREAKLMGKTCKLENSLHPDFVTYNIKHRHVLRWELTVTLAGDTFMAIHEAAVVVIPSCSWG